MPGLRTAYRRGRQFEYRVQRDLLDRGFALVLRMAGSHSPFDLVAFGETQLTAVQCKGNGVISPADRSVLETLAKRFGYAKVLIASRDQNRRIVYHKV